MNSQLSLSFKKATSRPLNLNVKRQHLLKILFSFHVSKQLEKWEWIMNIDEATIERLKKENYSWLIKGPSGSIKNISFSGSLNIISAISSTGASYSAIFICYLKKLLNSVKKLEGIPSTRILLILDNAPSHQAKEVLRYLEEDQIQYNFLPHYSSELAPVEKFFSQMKQKITAVLCKSINLNSDEGTRLLKTTLQAIDPDKVKSLWRHFYSKIRSLISESLL